MKTRKLTALVITLAMLALCACDAQPTEPTQTPTNVPETSETAKTTAPTESESETEAPTTEPTEPTTEATEVTTEAPDPKEDIRYYPYTLLEMTVEEIESAYGKQEYAYDARPVYYLPSLDIYLKYGEILDDNPLPRDLKPKQILYPNNTIYPGLYQGMPAEDIPETIVWEEGFETSGHDRRFSDYVQYTVVDEKYRIQAYFTMPEWVYETFGYIEEMTPESKAKFQEWGNSFKYDMTGTELNAIVIHREEDWPKN